MHREAAAAGLDDRPRRRARSPARRSAGRPCPWASVTALRGMRLSIALTTPPTALPPYSSAAGPRSTSMRSITSGSIGTAWSLLRLDASSDAPGVAEDADAVAVHAADDRPVGVRAEVARRHAGQAVQRVAERAAATQRQAVAAEHGGRRRDVGRSQGIAGHQDGSQLGSRVPVTCSGGGCGDCRVLRGRRCGKARQGSGQPQRPARGAGDSFRCSLQSPARARARAKVLRRHRTVRLRAPQARGSGTVQCVGGTARRRCGPQARTGGPRAR